MATKKITLNELKTLVKKIIKEEQYASFQNKFKKTNQQREKESMERVYGNSNNYPKELNNIIYTFIGKYENFAITKDMGKYNVFTWTRLLDGVELLDSFNNEENAKQYILKNN